MEIPEKLNTGFSKQIIWKYGLIAGAQAMAFSVILYIINIDYVFDWKINLAPLAITVVLGIMASLARRKQQDGFITFGESVVTGLFTYGIGIVISSAFNQLLWHVIDPQIAVRFKNMQLDQLEKSLRSSGQYSQSTFNTWADRISNPSIGYILLTVIGGILMTGIIGLFIYLIASIFIKNDSPFRNSTN